MTKNLLTKFRSKGLTMSRGIFEAPRTPVKTVTTYKISPLIINSNLNYAALMKS